MFAIADSRRVPCATGVSPATTAPLNGLHRRVNANNTRKWWRILTPRARRLDHWYWTDAPGRRGELARAQVLTAEGTAPWSIARNVLRAGAKTGWSAPVLREIRLGVLCSYESAELAEHLRLACLALGIGAECYVAPYGQLEQELLGGDTALALVPCAVASFSSGITPGTSLQTSRCPSAA